VDTIRQAVKPAKTNASSVREIGQKWLRCLLRRWTLRPWWFKTLLL